MKAKPISALIALSLLTFSLVAFAQQPATVGDLLDKGGKKLTKDELAKLVTGATISGIAPSSPNWKSQHTYKDDGSLSGHAFRFSGGMGTVGVWGKWSINEKGQFCIDIRNTAQQRFENCYFSLLSG
jgi:hypothetical protein